MQKQHVQINGRADSLIRAFIKMLLNCSIKNLKLMPVFYFSAIIARTLEPISRPKLCD